MGECCASLYANLNLGGWERRLFTDEGLDMYLCQTLCCDIKLFPEFDTRLDSNNLNLKFTRCYDQRKVSILKPPHRKRPPGRTTDHSFPYGQNRKHNPKGRQLPSKIISNFNTIRTVSSVKKKFFSMAGMQEGS